MLTTTDRLHGDPHRERQQLRAALIPTEPAASSAARMRDNRQALAALVAVNLQFGTLAAGA